MIELLMRYVAQGGVLIGVSAGSILMTPDISTSSYYGDSKIEEDFDPTGLNLVDFGFSPHFKNVPVELENARTYSKEHGIVVYCCKDGGGIIVSGDEVKCVGDVVMVNMR